MTDLVEKLKKKNLKATPQRLAIYKILLESKEHPSVETIYHMLRPTHATMSIATVYKTVDALKNAGLIQAMNVGEDYFRYDSTVSPHPHFVCLSCKGVYDFYDEVLFDLKDRVLNKKGFDFVSEQLFLYGHCPSCIPVKELHENDEIEVV